MPGKFLKLLRWVGLVRAEVRQVGYNIGQVRNGAGESELFRLRISSSDLRQKIMEEQVAPNLLVKAMAREWPVNKVLLHFDRLVERDVDLECQRIGLVEWMLRTQLHLPNSQCALVIQRNHWFGYLKEYALARDIKLIGYRRPWGPGWAAKLAIRGFRARRTKLPGIFAGIFKRILSRSTATQTPGQSDGQSPGQTSGTADRATDVGQASSSKIAIRYWYRKLGFDPTERTEFFWLNGSGIPHSEILLNNYMSNEPLDAESAALLQENGIRIMGRGPGIPRWVPTKQMPLLYARLMVILGTSALSCVARGRWVSIYHVEALRSLAWDYAYWHDFYSANNVRMEIGTLFTRVGQVLALDKLNGVSLSYQCSISTILAPSTELNAGEDLHVIYAPAFEDMWTAVGSPVNTFVHTGLLQGNIAKESVNSRVADVRTLLETNGAKYIICFLDENSNHNWWSIISHEQATIDYEYLLNWLLADPTLGLVFKPKNSLTLFQRIDRISGLIEKAKKTGRCIFLTSEYLNGDIFPADAATAADVCIGKLGGTAPLEARLAGIKTVLIDEEGFGGHPFYHWCRDRVAYMDWESLHAAVERYRSAPEEFPEFGEWSANLANFDSFQDGQGGHRMGSYIGWIHEELVKGRSKESALATVAKKYAENWGTGHVTVAANPQTTTYDE